MVGEVTIFNHDASKLFYGFVVKELVFDCMAALFEEDHDVVVRSNVVVVVLVLEWIYEDGVSVAVVGDHDVLVYTAREGGKASLFVGVELADDIDSDVYFV